MLDLHGALDLWRVGEPRKLRRAQAGLNNLSHLVAAPEGRYFLRRYSSAPDAGRIRCEHALLERLRGVDLPFETPRPLETESGETFAVVDGATFTLFPEIRGLHPERGNVGQVEACGRALGELDVVLAETLPPEKLPTRPAFGDLSKITPQVSDPLEVVDSLPVDGEKRAALRELFEKMTVEIPGLYERLPRQTIHSDLSYGNVLISEGRVSGVLDFEFAAPDLRALDFAIGLYLLCLSGRESRARWSLVEAFSRSYGRRVELTREEIEALPELLLLREIATLAHWFVKMEARLTSEEDIERRCRDILSLEGWLRSNADELVSRAGAAQG